MDVTTYKLKSAALAFAITFGLTAVTIVATSVPAHAAVAEQAKRIAVDTRDLNLASGQGQRALRIRVRQAAEKICIDPQERRLIALSTARSCIVQTIAEAAPQVGLAIQRDRAEQRSASLSYPSQP